MRVQEAIFSGKAFEVLLEFYMQWNEKNQNRAMRQVLEINAALLSLRSPQEKKATIKKLLSIVTQQAAHHLAKTAFKSLDCFLSKGSFTVKDLLVIYQDSRSQLMSVSEQPLSEIDSWSSMISDIFVWISLSDVAPAAAKFLVAVFSNMKTVSADVFHQTPGRTKLWQQGIARGLKKFPEALENVKNYLFPHLFKIDRADSIAFLQDLNSQLSISYLEVHGSDSKILLQLAALGVGKKVGLVDEPGMDSKSPLLTRLTLQALHLHSALGLPQVVILHEEAVGFLITHQLGYVRSLALSVLVSSPSTIRPFSARALEIIKSHMWITYADTDAKLRGDALSTTKNLIERLRGATSNLVKACPRFNNFTIVNRESMLLDWLKKDTKDETENLLKSHLAFVQWFVQFLSEELISTASYQRHITALKAIVLLLHSGILRNGLEGYSKKHIGCATVWPCSVDLFTPCMQRLLFDLVMDPFEDVRNTATVILKSSGSSLILAEIPKSVVGKSDVLSQLSTILARAKELSERTGRADSADGVAHLYELQYYLMENVPKGLMFIEELVGDLESKVSVAESDLANAVLEAPVHGALAALK